MAANLVSNVREALEGFPVSNSYSWLDSAVALHWIRSEGNYKQFVQNRVTQQNSAEECRMEVRPNAREFGEFG